MKKLMLSTVATSIVLAGVSVSALAQSQTPAPTTFDFTIPFRAADGKPMREGGGRTEAEIKADPKCDQCSTITIGQMAAVCLYNDTKAAPDKKAQEWALANRIRDNQAAALDAKEKVVIEDCVNTNTSPMVAGQVDHLIEPDKYPDK